MSVSAAARAAGVHRTTIHHWQRTSKEFRTAVEQARREFTESLADDMLDLAWAAVRTLQELVSSPDAPPSVRLKAALAVLERPQFPKRGWTLPVRLETPRQQEAVDGMAELEADYHMVRMTEAIRKEEERTESRRSRSGGEPTQNEPNLTPSDCRPTAPSASASGAAQQPEAQRARNSLCLCGSGQKYKRCCGKNAPPLTASPRQQR